MAYVGEYAGWLSLGLFFGFIRQPSIRALPVLSAQKFHFIFALISLTIRIICLVIGFLILKSDLYAVALYSISGGILDLLLILITLKIDKDFYG